MEIYNECKIKLIQLLDKHDIHTEEFNNIISIIDKETINNSNNF